ncbi:unnamed protein product [Rotaria socialis]|uniref:Protein kinase domain-containing protein n=1 Tax=Rotaria socialis TaxID=392032 RepID=A0A817WIF3_9BILA|nr:unnamed protein product [Rotaria socialis]
MAVLSKYNLEEYQYGVHVRKGRQLYMKSEKNIYFGQWITSRNDEIIIVEMSENIARREAEFYLEVNHHDYIVRTFASVSNVLNLTIFIQEYAPQGDLAGYLMDNPNKFTLPSFAEIFLQIADAMSHIASKRIVHGDLGCRNVLVFRVDETQLKNNLVKLTDFGLSRWIDQEVPDEDESIIPIRYCAPEILRTNRHSDYSEKSDVYSLGVLIWEALSNSEIPYSSVSDDRQVKTMKLNNEQLKRPHVCNGELWSLINKCWQTNPKDRPDFERIKRELSKLDVSSNELDLSSAEIYELPTNYKYELDEDIRIQNLLGGQFGKIYEAEWISRKERPIVVIQMNTEPSEYEAMVYTNFDLHRNIVDTFGFVGNDRGLILLLQERAPYGNLQALLQNGTFQPSQNVLITIFTQIVKAMIYVVSKGIVHGNLCCANIVVFQVNPSEPTENWVKLTNFVLAHKNDPDFSDDRRLVIPVRYCAPEILRSAGRTNYSEYSDVYSMGVLMWEALSNGTVPYKSSITNSEVRQRKMKGEKLAKPFMCDDQIWKIIADCWHNEPELRFEFTGIKIRLSQVDRKLLGNNKYEYELNVNVKLKGPLNGDSDKFYEADWIRKRGPPIVLMVMNEETAEQEVSLYKKFKSHRNIVETFDFVKNDRQSIMLLQERAPYGNLQKLLQSGNFQPSQKVLASIFLQITEAMIYLVGENFVHGDLRCSNVLVVKMDPSDPERNLVKLTNFSRACPIGQSVGDRKIPASLIPYCAPEIRRNRNTSSYSELSEVYSMGVLMWQACSQGAIPFAGDTSSGDTRRRASINRRLGRPKQCQENLWAVISDCFLNEPELRFSFNDLKTQISRIDFRHQRPVRCENCGQQYAATEIGTHRKTCPSRPIIHVRPPPQPRGIQCVNCNRQIPQNEITAHRNICRPKPMYTFN